VRAVGPSRPGLLETGCAGERKQIQRWSDLQARDWGRPASGGIGETDVDQEVYETVTISLEKCPSYAYYPRAG
jgi:hypothetical protein